jgi:CheY-like chemotaxis protein
MDGMLNEQEQQELKKVRDAFRISQDEHARLSRQVHIDSYVEALRIAWRDGLVTDNEEQVLQIMRRKFNITPEEHMSAEAHILWAKTAPNAKGTILVADDEKVLLLPLALRLKRHGYSVVTAESVEQALTLVEQSPPSLILSDLMFPGGKSGIEFYEEVRKNPAWSQIPFLLMSGIKDEFIIRAGLRLGVDSFLEKPFNLETLLAIIEGKLNRSPGAEQ